MELGATSPCKLIILKDRFAVVQFGDCIAMTALNGKYDTLLPLRSLLDRFLSISAIPSSAQKVDEVIALTGTGMMSIKIDLNAVARGDPR